MVNLLDITIEQSKSGVGGCSLDVELYADREAMDDIVDIEVLFAAIKTDGHYPLFTCSCGCFGCGGYYVDVACRDDFWILRNKYDPNSDKLIAEFEYRFPWEQVFIAITKIRDCIRAILTDWPNERILSGISSAFDPAVVFADKEITLREVEDGVDQEMFTRYLDLVNAEAQLNGKVFVFYSEESCGVRWMERGLEMASLSGWLVSPDDLADFERCFNAYYKENRSQEAIRFNDVYFPQMISVFWSLNRSGELVITFS